MNIRTFTKTITILCMAGILVSCAPIQPAEALPPLRVEYTDWSGDFTILIARELGLFEKYGVDVEPVYFPIFGEAIPALATGNIDGGLFALGDTLNTNSVSPVMIVALYDDGGTNYIVGTPDVPTSADVRGKRIGVPVGSIYELFVTEMLKQNGLTTRDVTLVNMDVEEVPASLGLSIDAGYVWDPLATEALANGGTLLYKSGRENTVNPDVIVFRKDVIERRPEDIRAFLQAWFEAVQYRRENPQLANEILARVLDTPVEELTVDSYIFTAQENRSAMDSGILTEAINANADFLIRIGSLSQKPILQQLVDPSFIP